MNRKNNNNISQQIRTFIARETERENITNNTGFMSGQDIKYEDCMSIMYTLQHRYSVFLPESEYCKLTTVGKLIQNVIRQQKCRKK